MFRFVYKARTHVLLRPIIVKYVCCSLNVFYGTAHLVTSADNEN